MNENIEKVIQYLKKNIDGVYSIEEIIQLSSYSKYHFYKIFELNTGESIFNYIKRLKLEKNYLKILQNESATYIDLDVICDNSIKFDKSFKKTFGKEYVEYKNNINNKLYKYAKPLEQTPQIIYLKNKYFICQGKHTNGYYYSLKTWISLFEQLSKFSMDVSHKNIALEINKNNFFGTSYIDSFDLKKSHVTYEACIECKKNDINILSEYGFKTKKINEGKYIYIKHYGEYENIKNSWLNLYKWIEENGYIPRDEPVIEQYINMIEKINVPTEQIIKIFIPIE